MYDTVVARGIAEKAYAEMVARVPSITDDFRVLDDMTLMDLIRDCAETFKSSEDEVLAHAELAPEVIQATVDVIRENHPYRS